MIDAPKTWLNTFVDEATFSPKVQPGQQSIERQLRHFLWYRGLDLGVPVLQTDQQFTDAVGGLAPLLRFLSTMSDYVALLAQKHMIFPEQRGEEAYRWALKLAFLRGLAVMVEEQSLLEKLSDDNISQTDLDKVMVSLGRFLLRRSYLFGNPLVGLTLNLPCIRIDTVLLATLLPKCFCKNPPADLVTRVLETAKRERAVAVGSIAALSDCRDDESQLERAATIWQIRHLGFGRQEANDLVRQATMPPSLSDICELVPDGAETRLFIHILIVAFYDGRVAASEKEFLGKLGDGLGVSVVYQKRLHRRIRRFLQTHRDVLNPLSHATSLEEWGAPLQVRLARRIRKNLSLLMEEIRETGDLAVLLGKKASGQELSKDEEHRMRQQLLDVVRVVPGLAIFSIPGGAIILPILMKLLPFDLRPSAFRDDAFHAFESSKANSKVEKTSDPEA
jgi:hypothetical protein